jgi:hypothetical protein
VSPDAPEPPVGDRRDRERFGSLRYDDFRRMAADETLSPNERAGFPEAFRSGYDAAILADIAAKLPALSAQGRRVVDIGHGTSSLALALRELCAARGHSLTLVDAPEVLAGVDAADGVTKVAARFPDCPAFLAEWEGSAHAVLAYSVVQYAFPDSSVSAFLDAALTLLRPGGRLLVGDIPNASMRRRFMASADGAAYHRSLTGEDRDPEVPFAQPVPDEIDDATLIGLAGRARAAGYHAWLVPQAPGLPLANRREDLLIHRP